MASVFGGLILDLGFIIGGSEVAASVTDDLHATAGANYSRWSPFIIERVDPN